MALDRPRRAQFEISVDGKPRSYRDTKAMAIEGAAQAAPSAQRGDVEGSQNGGYDDGGVEAAAMN